jgi:hypothetical protein
MVLRIIYIYITEIMFIFVANFCKFERATTSTNDFFEIKIIKNCQIQNIYHQNFAINYNK